MKAMNLIGNLTMAALMVVVLGACSKTKNGSTASSAASAACINTGAGWAMSGTNTPCTPGAQVFNPPNSNYPLNPGVQANYCHQYEVIFNTQYVPVIWKGDFACLRYDLMQPSYSTEYLYSDYYEYGYDYYYAYPPYVDDSCRTQVRIDSHYGSVNICF